MDIRDLDLNLLPILDALLRRRSVTRAAEELGMSQSAMSAALARLRAMFDDELFVRTGRGMLPTTRAMQLAGPVAELLGQLRDRVLAANRFDPATSTRAFTVCLSDVGSYVLWPKIVQRVSRAAPLVALRMQVLPQSDIAHALETAAIDVAVGAHTELPRALYQRRLFERRYVVLMRTGHPLEKARMSAAGFARASHVVVRLSSGIQEKVDDILGQQGLHRSATLEMPSYLMIPPLLEVSDYIAVLPGQLADAFSAKGGVRARPLPIALPPSVIRLFWHRRFLEDPGNVWLRGQIVDLFGRV